MGLRDFMKNILFEEEEEEEEEEYEPEEETPVEHSAAPRVEVSQRIVSPAPAPSPAPVSSAAPVNRPAQTLTANESSNTTTIFGDLDMENVSLSDQELSQRPSRNTKRRSYLERRVVNREYEPVLSPIFGNVQENERQFEQIHNAINLPKPSADFDMVQIISPIYGRQNTANEKADTRKGKRIAPTESKPKQAEPIEYDEQAFAVISTRNVNKKPAASDGFEQAAKGKHLNRSARKNREEKAAPVQASQEPAVYEDAYPAIQEPEGLSENIEKIDLKTFLSKKPKK